MFGSEDGQSASSALTELALLVGEDFYAAGPALRRHLVEHVKVVAREEQVLKIRHARLLAWMHRTDVSLVHYPSWTAFLKEHSLWKESRTRELIRFVESGLDHIIMLVGFDAIPLSLGLRAAKELPAKASELKQMRWLADAVENAVAKRHRSRMVEITGDGMRIVETARAIAKVLVGWSAPVPEIDRFIVDCFVQQLTEDQILERAKAVPPRPARLDEPPAPEWEHEPQPPVLGGWVAPRDQADCMAQLADVRARLEQRRMLLGMAYVHIQDHELWRGKYVTWNTLKEFCAQQLDLDQRTFQRYAREGRDLLMRPDVRTAIETGRVTCDRARFAIERAWGSESMEPWIDLASRLDRAEMERAEELEERVDVVYAPAVEMAKRIEALLGGKATGDRRSGRGAHRAARADRVPDTSRPHPRGVARRRVSGTEPAAGLFDVRPARGPRSGEVVRPGGVASEGARDPEHGGARSLLLPEPALPGDHDPGAIAPHPSPGARGKRR